MGDLSRRPGTAGRRPSPRHAQYRSRVCVGRGRSGRDHPGLVRRRHRRLPVRALSTGNVATEDLVYLFEREGIDTGVDLDTLIAAAEWLEGVLSRPLPGRVNRSGGISF